MMYEWIYRNVARPLLFLIDPEEAHHLAHKAAVMAKPVLPAMARDFKYGGTDLRVELAGRVLDNPVGLAAGFDKNGTLVEVLGHLGFGFAEIGSVTARPSEGNPKPRLFRLPEDQALINRLGLNGDGADVVAHRLSQAKLSLPVGINIAKTHDPDIVGEAAVEDVVYSFKCVMDLPVFYVALNVSCPNTREGRLEESRALGEILGRVQELNKRRLPLFLKLSPDSNAEFIEEVVECGRKHGLAGYICGNTTTSRDCLRTPAAQVDRCGRGGVSGPPLRAFTLDLCRRVYRAKDDSQSIIGAGGITSGSDAYEFIRSGATAVQIYTGLVYQGPTLPFAINRELSSCLQRSCLSYKETIGIDCR